MKTLLLACAAVFMLAGCQTKTIVEYRTVYEFPEDAWIMACEIKEPPAMESYVAAPYSDKEDILIQDSKKRIEDAQDCNLRLETARAWKARLKERQTSQGGQ